MSRVIDYDKEAFINLLRRRGIDDAAVLKAMATVPRETFVGLSLAEFAYDDTPLPIGQGQTISQPYMVALMIEAMGLQPGDRVLEIGTGSGYAAAVLSRVADHVYTIERHPALAETARERFAELEYDNIEVLCGDGTLGWPDHAPYDAIVVTAGGPDAPRALIEQLAEGGRLVIPTGTTQTEQRLLRMTRTDGEELEIEELGRVRFVPLVGEQGWSDVAEEISSRVRREPLHRPEPLAERVEKAAYHIPSIDEVNLDGLLERIGDARLVLLGEATHGTAEFYDMRARITRELIERKGFDFVAVEADWPDAAQIDHFVRSTRVEPTEEATFARFPTWMWANTQVLSFVKWLREHNLQHQDPDHAVGFYGLDLYSLYSSIDAVINYLEGVDKEAAQVARQRYGCLTPWQSDPGAYGLMARGDGHRQCEQDVVAMLNDLMRKRLEYAEQDGRRYLDAVGNARLVKNAEAYYRIMYGGARESWNFRDTHMVDTLADLLRYHGSEAKAVVWAHNSHLGDVAGTEMDARGEINVGHLCRQRWPGETYLVGFGTHTGTVAAASDWGKPMEIKLVRPSVEDSYERLCHDSGLDAFLLPLRDQDKDLRQALTSSRLERAIGVIYRPETEIASHYFEASLPNQFDEYIWFNETRAVDALGPEVAEGVPETFPFGV